ncbi:hypothetical protein BC834DRAFT_323771 [Gloeopeniophorella convolvens]|nr:hypothetical protein BC834DRAFT_323771 [Gloeopeniophorella convolvens]
MSITNVDLSKWIEGHHTVSRDGRNGEEVHVYAISGPPVFGEGRESRWDFDVETPIGGVIFILKGYIDLSTLEMDAILSARFPFTDLTLAEVKGNLKDGIKVTFDIPRVISGSATFYVRDGWVWMDLSVTIFGKTYDPISVKLFPLP